MEEWKAIVGQECYEVSNLGRVRRVARGRGATPGRILRPIFTGGSRGQYVKISLGRKGPRCYVHRLVADAFCGPQPSVKHEVNHRNGDTRDNRAENLEWVTRGENNLHAYRHLGKQAIVPLGEGQWNHKLTEAAVREIRQLWATGQYTQPQLGRQYQVRQSTISRIVLGQSWKHII